MSKINDVKAYKSPKIDFIEFNFEDVISTSSETCIADCALDSVCPTFDKCTHDA